MNNNTYKLTLNFTYEGVLKFNFNDERNQKISKLHYILEFYFQPPEIADFDEEFEKIVDKSFIEIAKHGHLEEIKIRDVYPKTNIFLEALENCEKLKEFVIQQDDQGEDDHHFYFTDKVLEKVLNLPNIENIWLGTTFLKTFPENKKNNTLKKIGLDNCKFYKKYIPPWSVEFTEPIEIAENISSYKSLEKLNIFYYCDELINSVEFFETIYNGLLNLKNLHLDIFKENFKNKKVLSVLDKFREKGVDVKLELL